MGIRHDRMAVILAVTAEWKGIIENWYRLKSLLLLDIHYEIPVEILFETE